MSSKHKTQHVTVEYRRLRNLLRLSACSSKPRNTLLQPELHISQLKQFKADRSGAVVYPDWYGHEEYTPSTKMTPKPCKVEPQFPAGKATQLDPPGRLVVDICIS